MELIKQNQDILRKFSFNKGTYRSVHKLSVMFSVEIKSYMYMSNFMLPISEKIL